MARLDERRLADVAATLGARWDGRAFTVTQDRATARLEPTPGGVELVVAHPDLPRDLWVSRAGVPHQGAVLQTHDFVFDGLFVVVTSLPHARWWFDEATRARVRRCLRGADRCSGLRLRLHRDSVTDDLAESARDALALAERFSRPAPPQDLLADALPAVRLPAATALADRDALEELLHHRSTVRKAALALSALPDPPRSVEWALSVLIPSGDVEVLDALARVGTAASLPALRRLSGAAARRAVAAIRERSGGEEGAVSLADGAVGALSAASSGGTLSLGTRDDDGCP